MANQIYGLDANLYTASVRTGTDIGALVVGVLKPIFFGLIIGLVACHKGLTTEGGTVGVGVSTTQAVVVSSICIIITDFFLSKILQTLMGSTLF